MYLSVAVARRLVVVTHNVSEFGRVPGVTVEDWS
jgi:predicted nucleic acid-binding protein